MLVGFVILLFLFIVIELVCTFYQCELVIIFFRHKCLLMCFLLEKQAEMNIDILKLLNNIKSGIPIYHVQQC